VHLSAEIAEGVDLSEERWYALFCRKAYTFLQKFKISANLYRNLRFLQKCVHLSAEI
jgi:hypothetical protein